MKGREAAKEKKYLLATIGAVAVLALVLVSIIYSIKPDYISSESAGAAEGVTEYSYLLSSNGPALALDSFSKELSSESRQGLELTVYESNLALVKEVRELELEEGLNLVEYRNVSGMVNPASVLFKDLRDSSTFVVEQNYEYDIASTAKLLEKYLGQQITVAAKEGESYTGTLLSYSDGIMLGTTQGIEVIRETERLSFPALPSGLQVKPSLVWKLYSASSGKRLTQTSYLTNGLNWNADYIAQVNENDSELDLSGWVTIQNHSGVTYPEADLTLMAGEIHTVSTNYAKASRGLYEEELAYAPAAMDRFGGGFSEESFFEYHAYKLGMPATLKESETKQISLMSAENIPVKKEYVYDSYNSEDVRTMLEFTNSQGIGLGAALPKGVLRVYKEDSGKQLQFIGEDYVDHTPKDEDIRVYIGDAFDILVERDMTSSEQPRKNCYKQSYSIEVTNRKESQVEVTVVEHLPRNAKILAASHDYEKKDAYTLEFRVPVKANESTTITYTEEHCW